MSVDSVEAVVEEIAGSISVECVFTEEVRCALKKQNRAYAKNKNDTDVDKLYLTAEGHLLSGVKGGTPNPNWGDSMNLICLGNYVRNPLICPSDQLSFKRLEIHYVADRDQPASPRLTICPEWPERKKVIDTVSIQPRRRAYHACGSPESMLCDSR